MSSHTDQIEEIKKAEHTAKHAIENAKTENDKKIWELQNKISTDLNNKEADLKDETEKKITLAEEEAAKIKQERIADGSSTIGSVKSNAENKKSEAISHVLAKFNEFIKN
ncbi:hypothetical protein GF340_01985 [Candidatus Peregrinibacteria bacterium]|nr:hypothetical protein [Candidatus Peregrinibacteria bacterium]